jgi:hypothetical protein
MRRKRLITKGRMLYREAANGFMRAKYSPAVRHAVLCTSTAFAPMGEERIDALFILCTCEYIFGLVRLLLDGVVTPHRDRAKRIVVSSQLVSNEQIIRRIDHQQYCSKAEYYESERALHRLQVEAWMRE